MIRFGASSAKLPKSSKFPFHIETTIERSTMNSQNDERNLLGSGDYGVAYSAFDSARQEFICVKEPKGLAGLKYYSQVEGRDEGLYQYLLEQNKQALIDFAKEVTGNQPMLSLTEKNLGMLPYLSAIYEIEEQKITMELVEGLDLVDFIEKNPETSDEQRVQYVTHILYALRFMHLNNVTHGDAELRNIKIGNSANDPYDDETQAFLIDFTTVVEHKDDKENLEYWLGIDLFIFRRTAKAILLWGQDLKSQSEMIKQYWEVINSSESFEAMEDQFI